MNSSPGNCRLERADGSVIPLTGNLSIGRSSGNGLVVPTEKTSRRHASLQAQSGGEIWLIDLGSVNGTFLNGRRVFQPMRLQNGDTFMIGGESFTFHQQELEEAEMDGMATVMTLPQVQSRRCWLLLADIENFTPMSQRLEPQELAITVGKWLRELREIVEGNGGLVDKYLGDGFLSFWQDGADVPARVAATLKAGRAMQLAGEPKFRLVLHLGSVTFGSGTSFNEESMMGPQVNFIFRMEKIAGALQAPIVLSEPAREILDPIIPCGLAPGEHQLKGFEGTFRFYVPAEL